MKSILTAIEEGRLIELPEKEKEKALRYLCSILEAVPDLAHNGDLYETMLKREAQGITALGFAVACPHIRASGEGEMMCAIGWSAEGLDYGAADGQKIRLVIMYYIPDNQKNTYLKEISLLVQALRKMDGITGLAACADINAVRDKLLDFLTGAADLSFSQSRVKMIKLNVKSAEETECPAIEPALAVAAVSVLFDSGGRLTALSQDQKLVELLEGGKDLAEKIKKESSFELAGYKLVFRSASIFKPDRVLREYLALKIP